MPTCSKTRIPLLATRLQWGTLGRSGITTASCSGAAVLQRIGAVGPVRLRQMETGRARESLSPVPPARGPRRRASQARAALLRRPGTTPHHRRPEARGTIPAGSPKLPFPWSIEDSESDVRELQITFAAPLSDEQWELVSGELTSAGIAICRRSIWSGPRSSGGLRVPALGRRGAFR